MQFKPSESSSLHYIIIFAVIAIIFVVGCYMLMSRGIWDELINSGIMRGIFSEFDQEEIGRKLEMDMMSKIGLGFRNTIFSDSVNTTTLDDSNANLKAEDSDEEDAFPDTEEAVSKKIDELADGKEVEMM